MKILIIIDMLNGFCRDGYPLSTKNSTSSIEKYIEEKIKEFRKNDNKYYFLCDAHTKADPEFKQYPDHCLKGTEEAKIVDTLIKYSNRDNIIYKNTLSVFFNTNLDEILSEIKPKEIHIVGVLTDICVLFAAYESRNRGNKTFVHKRGIQGLNNERQEFFIDYMEKFLGIEIIE